MKKIVKYVIALALLFLANAVLLACAFASLFIGIKTKLVSTGQHETVIKIEKSYDYTVYLEYQNSELGIKNNRPIYKILDGVTYDIYKDGEKIEVEESAFNYNNSAGIYHKKGSGLINFTASEPGEYVFKLHGLPDDYHNFAITIGYSFGTIMNKRFLPLIALEGLAFAVLLIVSILLIVALINVLSKKKHETAN